MNKTSITLTVILILILTACSASSATGAAGQATPSDSARMLSTQDTLLLGTIQLEETDRTVTAEQAAELLPLWQVYAELQTSDTAAQAEIDALLVQIEETMTEEQLTAIQSMTLSQQNAFAVLQQLGISTTVSNISASTTVQTGGGMTPPDGGGMGGDTPPEGGVGAMPAGEMGGTGAVASQTGTVNVGPSSPASSLIAALIEFLQSKLA